jgi:2-amino-4-hydroxy-6-hydroxymethyldihydropteridine diphosphokinase
VGTGKTAVTTRVFLGLGSNLGDRAANLSAARNQIAELGKPGRYSTIYETAPWGVEIPQGDYLNQVIELETSLDAVKLLLTLQEIERELGRGPHNVGEPRTIDIDILLYGDSEIATVSKDYTLFVPHPAMTERAFVLVPLLEIAPDLVHPAMGVRFRDIATNVDVSGVKPWYG